VGWVGKEWEEISSRLFQVSHNHPDLSWNKIPSFLLGIVAFSCKDLQETGRFANFVDKTVVCRLRIAVGIVALGELALEYGSIAVHGCNGLKG